MDQTLEQAPGKGRWPWAQAVDPPPGYRLTHVFDQACVLYPEHVGAVSEQALRSDSEQELEERFDRMIGEARALSAFLGKAKQAAIGAWRAATGYDDGIEIGNDAQPSDEDPGTGLAAGDAEISAKAGLAEANETVGGTQPGSERGHRQPTTSAATCVPEDRADAVRPELDLFVRDFHDRYGMPIPMELGSELRGASVKQLDRIRDYLKGYLTADGDPLRVLGNAIKWCA